MVVAAAADGFRQNDTGGENCLVDIEQVTPPCDFPDENRGKSFRSQLFVNAEKVDLGAFHDVLADTKIDGHGRYEGQELLSLARSHADMPLLRPARRLECPNFS